MYATKIALTAATLLIALTACDSLPSGGDLPDWGDDTGDTGWDDEGGAQQIAAIDYSCTVGSPDRWWYWTEIDGWSGLTTLDIFETGDGNWPSNPGAVWSESHDMRNTDWSDEGGWDRWEVELRRVTSIGQQVSGQSTLFGCNWDDGRSLAFKMAIYDDSGRELDCAIWGHESHQYFNNHLGDDCICFDNDGSCTN